MPNRIPAEEMIGRRFGRLVVRAFSHRNRFSQAYYWCECDCGTGRCVNQGSLRNGHTQSCGCYREALLNKTKGNITYRSWRNMIKRCQASYQRSWARYGLRGITVCDQWLNSFDLFLKDMGPRPSLAHSIERIDIDGDYEKSNCKWATPKEQARNRSNNTLLECNGETRCIAEWSELSGTPAGMISQRIQRGWSHQDAITKATGTRCAPTRR